MNHPDWSRMYQIAVVVDDLEQAEERLRALGIGPFQAGPSASTVERRIDGVPAPDVAVRGSLVQVGPIELELMEPVAGDSIQQRHLNTHGPSVVHLCAFTDDLDRDVKSMKELGYDVISYGLLDDGGQFAYFDTARHVGVVLELFEEGGVPT